MTETALDTKASVRPPAEPGGLSWRRASVRTHLFGLIASVAVPFIGLQAWTLYAGAQEDFRQARAQVLHLAQVTAAETAHFLADVRNIANGLAARPAIRAMDAQSCDPILKDLLALSPRFANLVTMGMDGVVVCSAVPLSRPTRGNPEGFLKLLRTPDQLTIGRAAPGVITGRWVIPVGRPLLDEQGKAVGVVVLPIDLTRFAVLPSLEGLPELATVGLVASDGTVLARSADSQKFVGTKVPAGRQALLRRSGTAEVIGIDGIVRIQGFAPVPGTDWVAIGTFPSDKVYAAVWWRTATSALLAIAVVLSALLLARHWARKIQDPVLSIAETAKEVAAGQLAARAPVSPVAEIADVATQFNRMLDARAEAERLLLESAEHVRGLSRRLIAAEETERRNINRELHDRVGQNLAALNLNLNLLRSQLSPAALQAIGGRLDDTVSLVEDTSVQIRNVMAELHPAALDDYGLFAALRTHVEAAARRVQMPIVMHGGDLARRLRPEVEMAFFRIAQGALANAIAHASAKRIEIVLEEEAGRVRLTIADDGIGFDLARAGSARASWGLSIMRERAETVGAALRVDSSAGRGTRVIVESEAKPA